MRREALLGVDAGTSSVKVCAFAPDGALLAKACRPVAIAASGQGRGELDVVRYGESVAEAVSEVVSSTELAILSIGFSTTCPTTILLDEHLDPVRPGLTYLDNRASRQAEAFAERVGGADHFFSVTGNRCAVSTCSVANLLWVRDCEAKNWARARHAGMLNTYLAAKLTGNLAVDWTQASYSGLFSLRDPLRWHADLVHGADLPEKLLPPIVPPYERIGTVTEAASRELRIPSGIPVAIGSADTAAAALAIGFTDPGTAFESVGTSGVLSFLLDKPAFDSIFMNRCHVLPRLWLSHGAISMMGGSLDWLIRSVWPDCRTVQELNEWIRDAAPGAHGVVFLPYLSGERCPIWDPHALGVWYGLTLHTTKVDMVEAVFESGAFALRQILEHGVRSFGSRIDSVLAVGEGAKSESWNQMKADILDLPYRPAQHADAAAYGAALMGGMAAGILAPAISAYPVLERGARTYLPRDAATRDAYARSYRIFTKLYPALREVMHAGGNF
jgi:xylulokinase